ncbi:MAG: YraN family protein [Ilumatobacteraceae bacterium]|nr:YraN family protein [Ilumatobacteraceae bacterium]
MGHVPQDSPRAQGARAEFQRPQHRRAARQQHLANQARASQARVNQACANKARARFAEDLVAAWYVRAGYTIIARNWRCPRGELDVVAWRDGVLVVCEVKARRSTNFGDPFEAITPAKIQRLRRATAAFVAARPSPLLRVGEIRFDAASVIGARVEVRESIV